jgi:hypothetical protein
MYFRVNGVAIFLKGSNMIPFHTIRTLATPQLVASVLQSAMDGARKGEEGAVCPGGKGLGAAAAKRRLPAAALQPSGHAGRQSAWPAGFLKHPTRFGAASRLTSARSCCPAHPHSSHQHAARLGRRCLSDGCLLLRLRQAGPHGLAGGHVCVSGLGLFRLLGLPRGKAMQQRRHDVAANPAASHRPKVHRHSHVPSTLHSWPPPQKTLKRPPPAAPCTRPTTSSWARCARRCASRCCASATTRRWPCGAATTRTRSPSAGEPSPACCSAAAGENSVELGLSWPHAQRIPPQGPQAAGSGCSARGPRSRAPPLRPARFTKTQTDRPMYQADYVKLYFDTVGDEVVKVGGGGRGVGCGARGLGVGGVRGWLGVGRAPLRVTGEGCVFARVFACVCACVRARADVRAHDVGGLRARTQSRKRLLVTPRPAVHPLPSTAPPRSWTPSAPSSTRRPPAAPFTRAPRPRASCPRASRTCWPPSAGATRATPRGATVSSPRRGPPHSASREQPNALRLAARGRPQ